MADRRMFLQGLVAASVAIPATVAARAADSEPDAELIALGQEWATSRERLDTAWEEHDAAADRYGDGPPPPTELFVRKSDRSMPYYACKHPSGAEWYGTPSVMERIRSLPLERMPAGILFDGSVRPAVPDPHARARRAEIVAAYERWQAGIAAATGACGLTAAIARINAEIEINSSLRRQIIDIPAVTLKGMLVKARVAVRCHGGIEEMGKDAFDGSPTDEALMCSLVLDLVNVGGLNV